MPIWIIFALDCFFILCLLIRCLQDVMCFHSYWLTETAVILFSGHSIIHHGGSVLKTLSTSAGEEGNENPHGRP